MFPRPTWALLRDSRSAVRTGFGLSVFIVLRQINVLKSRREAEQEACDHDHGSGEAEHSPVEPTVSTRGIVSGAIARTALARSRTQGSLFSPALWPCAAVHSIRRKTLDWINNPEAWIALFTLTALEIVLGIDNIIFVAILAERVNKESRAKARQVGLAIAVGVRVLLLFSIVWIMGLTAPLFSLLGHEFSGRDLILIGGGVFLLFKSTSEIHDKLEGEEADQDGTVKRATFASVLFQIALLDIVFSLDSVITAVGVAEELAVMVIAVVVAGAFMVVAASSVSRFVNAHPTLKMLALSFLLLIGMALVADGMGQEVPKEYIYFAMGFSVFVEMLNLRVKAKKSPVHLRGPTLPDSEEAT